MNEKDVNPADKALYEQTCLEAIPSDRLRGEFVVSRFFLSIARTRSIWTG